MKNIQLIDHIYYAWIDIILDLPSEKRLDYLSRRFKIPCEDDDNPTPIDKAHACFLKIDNRKKTYYFIFLAPGFSWSCNDIASLTHELYHLVEEVLRDIGLTHTKETEEAYCYYYQMLMKQLAWKINKYWRKQKGKK